MRAVMMMGLAMLGGCSCAYGGPGCGDPYALGLCAPVVQRDAPAQIEINYFDDTGLHPLPDVSVLGISDPGVLGVWPGTSDGVLHVVGLEVGTSTVELELPGWDQPGVIAFSVIADALPACVPDEYGQPPGFSFTGTVH